MRPALYVAYDWCEKVSVSIDLRPVAPLCSTATDRCNGSPKSLIGPLFGTWPILTMTDSTHATLSASGEGETYWTGFPNTIRLTGDDTDGALTVIEMEVPPGFEGPPHIHHEEHQTDHVVKGELVFTVGEDTFHVEEGSIIHCPKGVPHSFRNESDTEAVVLDWLHPAGHDEFMARSAERLTDPENPPDLDMQRVQELAPEYGLEMLSPGD